jgi:hypothetical protein
VLTVAENIKPNDSVAALRLLGVKEIEDRINCVAKCSFPRMTDKPVCIADMMSCVCVLHQAIQITRLVHACARFHDHLAKLLCRHALVCVLQRQKIINRLQKGEYLRSTTRLPSIFEQLQGRNFDALQGNTHVR